MPSYRSRVDKCRQIEIIRLLSVVEIFPFVPMAKRRPAYAHSANEPDWGGDFYDHQHKQCCGS